MFRYIVRRLLGAVVVVFIVSLVTFFLFAVGPKLTGSSPAYLYVGKNPTPELVAAVSEAGGLGVVQPRHFRAKLAQIEITPRPFPSSCSCLARPATIRSIAAC